MSKTYTVKLGDRSFTCQQFTLGDIEDIAEIYATLKASKVGSEVLYLALERVADPSTPRDEARKLRAPFDEFQQAIITVMRESGMKVVSVGESMPATAAP